MTFSRGLLSSWTKLISQKLSPLSLASNVSKYECKGCGRKQVAPFPEGWDQTSFGPKLISFISLCSSAYRMSKRTTQGLLKSLLNVDISLGSIPAMEKKISKALDPSFKALQNRVDQTKVAYVDETSFREEAQTCYVWTATTDQDTLFRRKSSKMFSMMRLQMDQIKCPRFADRLLTHYQKLFLFTRYPGVEPTNNAA